MWRFMMQKGRIQRPPCLQLLQPPQQIRSHLGLMWHHRLQRRSKAMLSLRPKSTSKPPLYTLRRSRRIPKMPHCTGSIHVIHDIFYGARQSCLLTFTPWMLISRRKHGMRESCFVHLRSSLFFFYFFNHSFLSSQQPVGSIPPSLQNNESVSRR